MSWSQYINEEDVTAAPKELLRSDWSSCESKFMENIPNFVSSIEVGNPLVGAHVPKSQPHAAKDVASASKKTEEKPVKKQERQGSSVESGSGEVFPKDATGPAEPSVARPEAVARPVPAEPNVPEQKVVLDEDWITPTSTSKTKAVPATAPSSVPTAPVPTVSFADFDGKAFSEEIAKMQDIVDLVKSFDLRHFVEQIPSLGVHVDLDAHRENPEVIAEAFTRLYGAYTNAHTKLMLLLPMRHKIDSVVDYLMDVGVAFSNASNKERRVGQVKLVLRDLLRVQEDVRQVCDSYERTCKQLLSQHDMVSRLFSWHQNYLLPRGIGMRIPSGEEQSDPRQTDPRHDRNPRYQPPPASPQPPVGISVTMDDEKKPEFEERAFQDLEPMPSKPTFKDKKPGFVDFGKSF